MYDKHKLLGILLQESFRTIQNNGRLYPPSAEIYQIISKKMKELDINVTPKHIYVIINENRNGFRDKIIKTFNIEIDETVCHLNATSSSIESSRNDITASSKEFDIIIPSEQWKTISPIRKLYGRRYKYVLQSGWTDIICDKAWQQQAFTCTISFKKHDVYESSSAKYFIGIHGICKECNAIITGKIMQRPRDNVDVKIHFVAYNIIEENHCYKKKRQLRGKRRQIVTNTLIDRKLGAAAFRREEAKHLKGFGDIEPPIIPNACVIRKAKEQALIEKYGFLYTNPILNLFQSAKQGKYYGAIHNIELLKFCCMYWTTEQQLLYKSRNRKDLTAFMTIDATGSIIKRNSDCESPIFLYQCMLVDSGGNIPVFQMVSADHKAMHISYFLQKIISTGNEAPRMVVCDFSWAILIAVAQVFAKCVDLRNYLKKCYNILNDINDILPSCLIRLDVSHFVSMISRWNCLKHKDKLLVRKFYLRSLSQAYKMNSLVELSLFFEAILVVSLSEYIGFNEFGKELISEVRLQYLNNIIKYVQAPEISNEISDNVESIEKNYSEDQEATDWFDWSTNIYNNAERIAANCTKGSTINACYNPDLAAIMRKKLMPYVAIWSGIMQSHFQIDKVVVTSTSVEAEFAQLKNREFKGQLPMRVDKFVHEHLNYIDGRIKLASSQKDILDIEETNKITDNSSSNSVEIEIDETADNYFYSDGKDCDIVKDISAQSNNIQDITSDTSDNSDKENLMNCNVCENWGGIIRKSPQEKQSTVEKRRKPSYLDKCPDWDYIKLAKDQNIPLMRNGNVCKGVILDGKTINISDTCAFDSIFHLIASGIANIKHYEEKVKTSNNHTINLAMSILQAGKITACHYKDRAKILIDLSLFSDALTIYTDTISKLNANCNVAHLNCYLFTDVPSYRATIVCPCGYLRRRQIIELSVNVDILLANGLQYMQQAIDDALQIVTKCRKCFAIATETIEYGPHLFIDTTIFTDDRYNKMDKKPINTIKDISLNIKLNMRTYVLVGLIHYVSGHYVTYTRCGTHWYEYDDLKKKRKIANDKTIITPHLIFYVTAEV